jgi:hypothetical protein
MDSEGVVLWARKTGDCVGCKSLGQLGTLLQSARPTYDLCRANAARHHDSGLRLLISRWSCLDELEAHPLPEVRFPRVPVSLRPRQLLGVKAHIGCLDDIDIEERL